MDSHVLDRSQRVGLEPRERPTCLKIKSKNAGTNSIFVVEMLSRWDRMNTLFPNPCPWVKTFPNDRAPNKHKSVVPRVYDDRSSSSS